MDFAAGSAIVTCLESFVGGLLSASATRLVSEIQDFKRDILGTKTLLLFQCLEIELRGGIDAVWNRWFLEGRLRGDAG